MPMKYLYTDYSNYRANVERANYFFTLFDAIPDALFKNRGVSPSLASIKKLKLKVKLVEDAEKNNGLS